MKVYLAGPIANMDDEKTHHWRDMVSEVLNRDGIETINPAKLRDFRNVPYPENLAVVGPDKVDIGRCDVLFANAHTVSVGTSMEVMYAWDRGKFVVVVHPDPVHASPWLRYHAHDVVPNLWMALADIFIFRSGGIAAWNEFLALPEMKRTARD